MIKHSIVCRYAYCSLTSPVIKGIISNHNFNLQDYSEDSEQNLKSNLWGPNSGESDRIKVNPAAGHFIQLF